MKITRHSGYPAPTGTGVGQPFSIAPASPATSVTTDISEEGRTKSLTSGGLNAASPSRRAREMVADYETLGYRNFGALVSAIARGDEVVAAPTGPVVAPEPPGVPEASAGVPVEPPLTAAAADGTGEQ